MKIFGLCLSCFFTLSSCLFQTNLRSSSGRLSSQVTIRVSPYAQSDEIKYRDARKPVIFPIGGELPCRPHPFNYNEARQELGDQGLSKEFLDNLFGAEAEGQGLNTETSEKGPVRREVQNSWTKFGLIVGFGKEEETSSPLNDVVLVITDISYVAVAREGNYICSKTGNISAGYCNGPSFLYVIPYSTIAYYDPISSNPFTNLILYIDGLPIIDRRSQPSPRLQSLYPNLSASAPGTGGSADASCTETQSAQTNSNAGLGSGVQQNIESLGGSQNQISSGDLIVTPEYEIELTIYGDFRTKSGKSLPNGHFHWRESIYTASPNI